MQNIDTQSPDKKFSIADPIKDWEAPEGVIIPKTVAEFEQSIQSVQPRFFDTYILAPFMMWYAWKSKAMRINTRRVLFASGVYMFYRNYAQYKKGLERISATIQPAIPSNNGVSNNA